MTTNIYITLHNNDINYLEYLTTSVLFRRNSFRDFLNITNGTLLSSCAISAFQIFALTEEKDWVPEEMWNISFALVLHVCTSLFLWYNEF